MIKTFIFALMVYFPFMSLAQDPEFLPVEKAFPYQWSVSDSGVQVHFAVQPQYYLYKARFKFSSDSQVLLSEPQFSLAGTAKKDQYFGDVVVFNQPVTVLIPYSGEGQIKVRYQGCSEKGLCYLPQTITLDLPLRTSSSLPDFNWQSIRDLADDTAGLSEILVSLPRAQALLIFFLLGLGLSLTPCVLPMIPILSSIIGGEAKMTGKKGLILSSSYVLGMSSSYAITGILVTTLAKGVNLQAMMQQPWLLSLFAFVFIVLALAMFGFYELQLPNVIQQKLTTESDKIGGGKVVSVFVMGAVSALVVSPCVSAPLAGALLYVSTTQNWILGGMTLFVMALGMGVPLILVGISGGKWLPKSGPWMVVVKQLFGVLLLAVAIVLVSRFAPSWLTMLFWAMLAIGSGIHFGALDAAQLGWARARKFAAFMSLFYGLIVFVGMLLGSQDPLKPLKRISESSGGETSSQLAFTKVNSVLSLQQNLALAKQQNQRVVLDLYADWCVSCKDIEQEVFAHPSVLDKFSDWKAIKFDVTQSTKEQMAWLAERNVFGPPAVFFYNSSGLEFPEQRVVGAIGLEHFQSVMSQL
ncbi:thiol:disulfide interchange protein DsbD [Vibrio zhanjiangensis]|uniref:Thiol:disulfide interchange protein DsbD n=1 Tax=Vibrio zhanjiangensis TaxID=1046128 RepID=A0ABQ6F2F3_9VIBR|nr:protein-disulfide reductase DsbD [Vibrio zhanjiangensis]GLT19121.1 thiol:disulfide interchange protein DsbD [Vibrio zhanjiangensis]